MTRDEQILASLPIAKKNARIFARSRRVPFTDHDDVYNDAVIGLIRAVDTFDASKGAAFKTHAENCVMHAMYDGARTRDRLNTFYRRQLNKGHYQPVTHVSDAKLKRRTVPPNQPTFVDRDVRQAVRTLPKRDQQMLNRIYWQEQLVTRSVPECKTESGAAQAHRSALKRLRKGPLAIYGRAA